MDESTVDRRMEDLESRLAFQDDHIQQLNDIITQLQLEVMNLNERLNQSERQIQELTPSMIKSLSEETPPPHY